MSTFGLPDLPKFGEEQERWLAEQEVKKKTTVVKSDGFNLGQLFTCGACGRKPGRSSEEARAVLERRPTMRTRELEALKAELAAAQETAARAEALKADLMAAEKRALYTAMKERQSREATEAEMSKKAEQAEDRAAKAEFDKIKADLAAEAEKAARQNDTDRLNQRLAMEEKRAADQASREKAELAFEVSRLKASLGAAELRAAADKAAAEKARAEEEKRSGQMERMRVMIETAAEGSSERDRLKLLLDQAEKKAEAEAAAAAKAAQVSCHLDRHLDRYWPSGRPIAIRVPSECHPSAIWSRQPPPRTSTTLDLPFVSACVQVRLAREADIEKLKDGLVKAEDRATTEEKAAAVIAGESCQAAYLSPPSPSHSKRSSRLSAPSHSHPPIHTISFTGELAELKATVRRQSMALKQQKKENEELQEVSTLA